MNKDPKLLNNLVVSWIDDFRLSSNPPAIYKANGFSLSWSFVRRLVNVVSILSRPRDIWLSSKWHKLALPLTFINVYIVFFYYGKCPSLLFLLSSTIRTMWQVVASSEPIISINGSSNRTVPLSRCPMKRHLLESWVSFDDDGSSNSFLLFSFLNNLISISLSVFWAYL